MSGVRRTRTTLYGSRCRQGENRWNGSTGSGVAWSWTPMIWKSSPDGSRSFRLRVIRRCMSGASSPAMCRIGAWRASKHYREDFKMLLFRIAALAISLGATALPASAADYPDHAIKMIVPFAAGGGTDVLARIIAQNLNNKWGQPVVVENQP